ncbi:MAG: polymorphic toxin-type HINT domain-containing protein [Pseudomonadota bacterium]|nr:polymorphic toxin-type HINT domain-containing protein [Pseudomonadota bacterium]
MTRTTKPTRTLTASATRRAASAPCSGMEPAACFAKGTLVHTKDGHKPIEQIQMGDWVLSKPENGGEQADKRVVKTFVQPLDRIVGLVYTLPGQDLEDLIQKGQGIKTAFVNTTLNHPVWTKEEGWITPAHIQPNGMGAFHFEASTGVEIEFWAVENIYRSEYPDVGWTSKRWPEDLRARGTLWNYDQHQQVA